MTARLALAVRRLQESLAHEQREQEKLDAKLAEALAVNTGKNCALSWSGVTPLSWTVEEP